MRQTFPSPKLSFEKIQSFQLGSTLVGQAGTFPLCLSFGPRMGAFRIHCESVPLVTVSALCCKSRGAFSPIPGSYCSIAFIYAPSFGSLGFPNERSLATEQRGPELLIEMGAGAGSWEEKVVLGACSPRFLQNCGPDSGASCRWDYPGSW